MPRPEKTAQPTLRDVRAWVLVVLVAACSPPPEEPGTGGGSGGRGGGRPTGGGAGGAGGTAGSSGGGTAATGGGSTTGTGGGSTSGTGGGTTSTGGGTGGSGGSSGSGGGNTGNVNCANFADTPATACGNPDTPGGICRTRLCQPCTDPADDARCVTAYGAGHLCEAGACVRGACRTNADCGGQLCLLPARVCVRCTSDVQCGPGNVCNTASGACQGATCANANAACTANANDFCCGGSCVRGTCYTSAQCSGAEACIANTCTTCAAPTGNVLCVDPAGGDDLRGTGAAGCCFRTLTRAVETPNDGGARVISLRGNVTGAGESFPLRLPPNVSVTSDVNGTPRSIAVAPGAFAFELSTPGSSLTDLELYDGGGGVRVLGTASFASNVLTRVHAHDMSHDGVRVELGSVAIDGTFERNANGLRVWGGTGRSVIGSAHFDDNRQHGIWVDRNGSVVLFGNDAGSLTASRNGAHGLMLLNTPGTPAPVVRVEGLFALDNGRDGMRVGSNSNLAAMNGNVLQGNARSGISVRSWAGGTGTVTLNGTLRPNVYTSNAAAQLCIEPQSSLLTVDARASVFGTRDCSLASSTGLDVTRAVGCTGGVDVGGVRLPDGGGPTGITVRLAPCQDL